MSAWLDGRHSHHERYATWRPGCRRSKRSATNFAPSCERPSGTSANGWAGRHIMCPGPRRQRSQTNYLMRFDCSANRSLTTGSSAQRVLFVRVLVPAGWRRVESSNARLISLPKAEHLPARVSRDRCRWRSAGRARHHKRDRSELLGRLRVARCHGCHDAVEYTHQHDSGWPSTLLSRNRCRLHRSIVPSPA